MHINGGSAEQGDGALPTNKALGDAATPVAGFQGFDADSERFRRLLTVLTCLTRLQQAVEKEAFDRAAAGSHRKQDAFEGNHGATANGYTQPNGAAQVCCVYAAYM
jgi:hypothetical protein